MPVTSAIGSPRGFSLVELMVVLAIVAMLAASMPLALNRFMPARRTISAAERLIANVQRLQSSAASSGAAARLIVTDSGYQLEFAGRSDADTVALPASMTLHFRAREEDRPLHELTVYPDGTASPGRFELADSGRTAVIEIGMLTGRARRVR